MSLRVVGIDPSLTSTGIVVVEDGMVNDIWHRGSPAGGDSVRERADRINDLAGIITGDLFLYDVDAFIIEGPSHGSRFGKPHERAGLWWAITNGLMSHHTCPIYEVAPQSRAKYATGKGNSKKALVYSTVKQEYADQLGDTKLRCDDEGDALLLAAMGSRVLGCPVEAAEPAEDRLAALSGLVRQVEG